MFYLLEVAEGDSKIAGKAVYEFETENEALANYHSKIGTAMKSPLYKSQLCMIINENGGTDPNTTNKYVREETTTAEKKTE